MELTFDKVESLLNLMQQGKYGKRVDLLEDIYGDITKGHLSIYKRKPQEFEYDLSLPGKRKIKKLGVKIDSEVLSCPALKRSIKNKDEWMAFLDMDKLKPPLVLRNRKNGDRFRPLGMKGTKSVADYLVDTKVPRCDRDEVMLLTSRNKIAWVVGYRICEDFKVAPKTKKVIKIQIERE